jgi:hypothetical protein
VVEGVDLVRGELQGGGDEQRAELVHGAGAGQRRDDAGPGEQPGDSHGRDLDAVGGRDLVQCGEHRETGGRQVARRRGLPRRPRVVGGGPVLAGQEAAGERGVRYDAEAELSDEDSATPTFGSS